MIGTLAGDIIGSPYRFENIQDTARFIGWNLFDENRRLTFYANGGKQLSLDEFNNLSKSEQRRLSVREKTYKAEGTFVSDEALVVADYLVHQDAGGHMPDTLTSALPIGIACGEYARTSDNAIHLAQEIARMNILPSYGLRDSIACAHVTWLLSHGGKVSDAINLITKVYEYNTHNEEEMSMLLKGQLVEVGEKLEIGDGHKPSEMKHLLPAALHCINISRSYEEAVRRAAALGGASNELCALTGAFAEHSFGVPEDIKIKASAYFSAQKQDLLNYFETKAKSKSERKSDNVRLDNSFFVIRQGAKTPIYVIPQDRLDIEDAVRRLNKSTKRDTVIIRPEDIDKTLADLSHKVNAEGKELSGTFIDTENPEIYKLWLQEGQIKSSSSRLAIGDEKLASIAMRASFVNSFEELKTYANEIRTELERQAGYDGPGHIHFETAFYPVVKNRSIDLMQGDILRGSVHINENGRIAVNTNAQTGSSSGEYLEGVLNSMDIFHKNDGIAEIKQKLNEFCLDYGKIEDEEERIALTSDDSEADSVKMKYKSNVDTAVMDMSRVRELEAAVSPELTMKELKRLDRLAEMREESRVRYTGMSRQQAIDSTRYSGSIFTVGHSNHSAEDFQKLLKRYGIDTLIDVRSFAKSENFPHFNSDTLKESLNSIDISYHYAGRQMGGRIVRKEKDTYSLYMIESDVRAPKYELFRNDAECLEYCKALNKSLPQDSRYITYMSMTDEQVSEYVNSKDCSQDFANEIKIMTGKCLTYEEVTAQDSYKEELKHVRELVKDGHRVAVMCSEGDPEMCHRFAMVGYTLAHPSDGRIKPIDVQHITRKGTLISQDYLEKKVIKSLGLSEDSLGLSKAMHKKCISNLTRTKSDLRINISKNKSIKR